LFLASGEKKPVKKEPNKIFNQGSGFMKPKDGGEDKKNDRRDPAKTIAVWLLVIVLVFLGLRYVQNFTPYRETQLTYSQFKKLLETSPAKIKNVAVVQQGLNHAVLNGELTDGEPLANLSGVRPVAGSKLFTVNLPFVDSEMLKQWDAVGFPYSFETEKWNMWDMLLTMAPWIVMILIWLFMIRQMQAGQKGIFSFGKSRAKLNSLDRPQNNFNDVAGVEEAKIELEEIIEFLKDPQKFRKLGGKIPKGVLLLGPPGTGKTLLARCVAGEAGVPFLSMSGSDFVEMFVGVGASRVRDLFDTAKKNSPCIIFIDEIDAVGRQRGAGLGGGHDEREQTLNQMLVEMDGFEINSGVILIAATNRPDVLDPALLRPGRFDRQVVVDVPDINGREGILRVHTKKIPLSPDVDLATIARGTPGFVGADLANLVNEAALMAARFGQEAVTMLDFEEAKDKVSMGVERKSMVLSEKEKRNTAYHESGHAICNIYCTEADPLHKVTIIPRGRALGVTWSLPTGDKYSQSVEYILDKVCIMLGGRAAEEIIFNTKTTGAFSDIKEATRLVRRMVCDFGMTDELGPLSYGDKGEQIFLGREFNQHRDYSEKTAQEIDALMRRIMEEQYARARALLNEHRDQLERLALALIEFELLDAGEVKRVINGEVLGTAKKTRTPPNMRKPAEPGAGVSGEPVAPDAPAEPATPPATGSVDTKA
jgi:cell division protease FtsH